MVDDGDNEPDSKEADKDSVEADEVNQVGRKLSDSVKTAASYPKLRCSTCLYSCFTPPIGLSMSGKQKFVY